jgi:hypothetical protein
LARLTGRQRPERDARRMLQSTIDGVFSNMSAKPRVEKPYEEELPPVSPSLCLSLCVCVCACVCVCVCVCVCLWPRLL